MNTPNAVPTTDHRPAAIDCALISLSLLSQLSFEVTITAHPTRPEHVFLTLRDVTARTLQAALAVAAAVDVAAEMAPAAPRASCVPPAAEPPPEPPTESPSEMLVTVGSGGSSAGCVSELAWAAFDEARACLEDVFAPPRPG